MASTSPQAQTNKELFLQTLQNVATSIAQWRDSAQSYPGTAQSRGYGPGGANEVTDADCLNTIGVNLVTTQKIEQMIGQLEKFFVGDGADPPAVDTWGDYLNVIRADR